MVPQLFTVEEIFFSAFPPKKMVLRGKKENIQLCQLTKNNSQRRSSQSCLYSLVSEH